jgi:hypothetical protein
VLNIAALNRLKIRGDRLHLFLAEILDDAVHDGSGSKDVLNHQQLLE